MTDIEDKHVKVSTIRCGEVFVTERGDVCIKLAYAIGAPKSAVAQETVRAADLGNGEIYELPPFEMVIAGPKAFDLYQFRDEAKTLKRQLDYEQGMNSFDAKRLRRLATMCGCSVSESDEIMLGCAGTVIGAITRKVEELLNQLGRNSRAS